MSLTDYIHLRLPLSFSLTDVGSFPGKKIPVEFPLRSTIEKRDKRLGRFPENPFDESECLNVEKRRPQ